MRVAVRGDGSAWEVEVMRALLTVVALLLTVSPASADWVLYRLESRVWRVSGTYQDLKACEADAKAQAEKFQTKAGCADEAAVKKQAEDLQLVENARKLRWVCNEKSRAVDSMRTSAWQKHGVQQSDRSADAQFSRLAPECGGIDWEKSNKERADFFK